MGLFLNNELSNFMVQQKPKLNETVIWFRIMGFEDTQDYIIELNTQEQLFEKGIDSEGTPLKDIGGTDATDSGYSPVTIEFKKRKGGRTDNITLFDTGDYYDSHEVIVTAKGFEIRADPQKSDTNLFVEWGKDIVGLTDESLQKLINFLLTRYSIYTHAVIFKR